MATDRKTPRIPEHLESAYTRANHATGGWLGVLRTTLDNFTAAHGAQAAAGLAYYGLFSLFPLIVLLVTVLGIFVDPVQAQALVGVTLHQILPNTQGIEELVVSTVRGVFAARGEVTVISLLALLWAASGMFTNLTYNIDLAWSEKRRANPLKARLIGLLMVVLAYLGLVALLLSSATLGVLALLPETLLSWLGFSGQIAQTWTVRGVSLAVMVFVFYGMYRWVPRARVPGAIAFWSALLAALATQALTVGFTWYLGSGFANYERLYGPLTTIIVLMFWFYLTVVVILFGAHLSASLAQRRKARQDAGRDQGSRA